MAEKELIKKTEEPAIPLLQEELRSVMEDASTALQHRDTYDDVRFSRHDGQSEDGRKHESDLGFPPSPWEGASDVRIRLADRLVNEHVNMATTAFFRANLRVTGIEVEDNRKAAIWTDVLKYYLHQKLLPELRAEVEVLAQNIYGTSPGVGILGVYWTQEVATRLKKFTLDDVVQAVFAAGGDQDAVMDVVAMLEDPEVEDQALEMMRPQFPTVPEKQLKKALKAFRKDGEADIPQPYLKENRPQFVAHRLYEDIFVAGNTTNLERAEVIFRREWFTETEIREKGVTEEWPEDFVEEVIEKTEGQTAVPETDNRFPLNFGMRQTFADRSSDFENLYEIFYAYTKTYDEETDVPCIYCTAFSAHVGDMWGKHEMLNYSHGMMPFVLFTRERLSHSIFDSRGIPELVSTNQYEIATQRNLRSDASQIGTIPPMLVNARRGGINLLVAPGAQLTVTRPDDVGWLQPPPFPSGSVEAENAALKDVDDYFGGNDPGRKMLHQQAATDRWLDSWRIALDQAFRLCQQYMSPTTVQRLTNGKPEEIQVSQDDIQGKFDLALRFSVDVLNPEFQEKKLDAIVKLTQFDVTGALDRTKLLTFIAEQIDPQLADAVIMDQSEASAKEISDEQEAWVKIALEIEPVMTEDVNFPLRLQTAQQIVQASTEIQQKMQGQPLVKQLADNRIKYLQFGIQQQQNAQIGRVGTSPVAQQGAAEEPMPQGQPQPQQPQQQPQPEQAPPPQQPQQAGGGY